MRYKDLIPANLHYSMHRSAPPPALLPCADAALAYQSVEPAAFSALVRSLMTGSWQFSANLWLLEYNAL